ncbi:MAG: hypothetical protein WCO69_02940 [Candidatus Omnitrophota bacterium]
MKRFFFFWGAAIVLFYFCYSSFIIIPFAHNDNIYTFHKFRSVHPQTHSLQYDDVMKGGRPVSAWIEQWKFLQVYNVADYSFLRAFLLVFTAAVLALLACFLCRYGYPAMIAWCLSAVMFTLPGIIDPLLMCMPHIILAIAWSLAAYLVLETSWPRAVRWPVAAALVTLGLMTYQANICFFFLLTGVHLFSLESTRKRWKALGRSVLLFTAGAIAYLGIVHFFIMPLYPPVKVAGGGYSVVISWVTIVPKVCTLFAKVLPVIFDPAPFFTFKAFGYCLFSFVLATYLFVLATIKEKKAVLSSGAMGGFLFLAASAAWLLSSFVFTICPRVFLPASGLAVLGIFWAVSFWMDRLKCPANALAGVAVTLLLLGASHANYLAINNAWNYNMELNFVRAKLAEYPQGSVKRIHVVESQGNSGGYDGLEQLGDNLNAKTVQYSFTIPYLVEMALVGVWDDTTPLFTCEAPQPICVAVTPPGQILLSTSRPGAEVYRSEGMVYIDMNDLPRISSRLHCVRH